MRIDPSEVFGHTVFSVPWRLFLGVAALGVGILTGIAFEPGEFDWYRALTDAVFFPFTLADAALISGLWGFVTVPALVASIWMVMTFAYDGRGGMSALLTLYVFAYLIVMFRKESQPLTLLLFGAFLAILLTFVRVREREANT